MIEEMSDLSVESKEKTYIPNYGSWNELPEDYSGWRPPRMGGSSKNIGFVGNMDKYAGVNCRGSYIVPPFQPVVVPRAYPPPGMGNMQNMQNMHPPYPFMARPTTYNRARLPPPPGFPISSPNTTYIPQNKEAFMRENQNLGMYKGASPLPSNANTLQPRIAGGSPHHFQTGRGRGNTNYTRIKSTNISTGALTPHPDSPDIQDHGEHNAENEEYIQKIIKDYDDNQFELKMLSGKIPELCVTQTGSRFLQKQLTKANPDFIQFILDEVTNLYIYIYIGRLEENFVN